MRRLGLAIILLATAACVPPDSTRPDTKPVRTTPVPVEPAPPAVVTRPVPVEPEPGPGTVEPIPPVPVTPSAPPVGAAGLALLNESRAHQAAGRYPQAAASIERALRIEPRQPLLWIELGNIRLLEGNRAQAETLGRRALSLSGGDPMIEERAQRLIGEAKR